LWRGIVSITLIEGRNLTPMDPNGLSDPYAKFRLGPQNCQLDLSTLTKEKTHRLELPLEECRGVLVLLVTLTASAAVSIADLSLTPLEDPEERREILRRYVSSNLMFIQIYYLQTLKGYLCYNVLIFATGSEEVIFQLKGCGYRPGEGPKSRRTHGCRCNGYIWFLLFCCSLFCISLVIICDQTL
ncbi:hypothetical protein XENOCAPTIV_001638, partial [Xenoophorus captivus]